MLKVASIGLIGPLINVYVLLRAASSMSQGVTERRPKCVTDRKKHASKKLLGAKQSEKLRTHWEPAIFLFLRHLQHGVAGTPVSFLCLLCGAKDYATDSWTIKQCV